MKITDRQIEILEKFACERLHSNSSNLSLIKNFYSERGSELVISWLTFGFAVVFFLFAVLIKALGK